ncbi:MAG: HEAT repeat domain-containing protein, partial [Planctomycetaceae bacterium]|nr:HEAT repeat domain-containing protein [Planctomycetaceae bacterium]
LDAEQFREVFRKTPLERPGRAGVLRTACIVLGNVGGTQHLPALVERLNDDEPLVRGAAAWAIAQLGGDGERAELQSWLQTEDNESVQQEIHDALSQLETKLDADSD